MGMRATQGDDLNLSCTDALAGSDLPHNLGSCFTFNSTEDLAAVPGLNSAFNVLRLRRPIIFHQTCRILDNPLPFLTTSQREFQLPKAVRFASSIHSAASTPASEAEEGDAFSEERARERQSFGEALDAQHPEPISEAELLPRLCKILLVVRLPPILHVPS
jgi:hypothetical protein